MTETLARDLVLLAFDESGARLDSSTKLDVSVAAAALADLVDAGVLRRENNTFVAGGATAADPLLARVADHAQGRSSARALSKISGLDAFRSDAHAVRDQVLNDLAEGGVLRHEEHRKLGVIKQERWVAVDSGAARDAVLVPLREALSSGRVLSGHEAALLSLVVSAGLASHLLPGVDDGRVKELLSHTGGADWPGRAAAEVIDNLEAQTNGTAAIGAAVSATIG